MDTELEKLLEQKSFGQLSQTEKEYVQGRMTEEEYERLGAFLKISRNSSEEDYSQMNPNPRIKSRLKVAYQQQFNEKTAPNFFKENKIFKRPVARTILTYTPIAASVILAVVMFFELKDNNFPHSNMRTTAMDIDQIENFELLQDQMSLKETGMYSKIIVPETDVEMSLVRSDTLLMP